MPRPLFVLLLAAIACVAAPGCSREPQRNVVLIVVDTLRKGEREPFDLQDELDAKPIDEPETVKRLAADLDAYAQLESARPGGPPAAPAAPAWSPEEVERLRALGYAE